MDIISFAKASAAGGDIQLKTVNGNSLKGTGNIAITTYQAFPEGWADYTGSNKTTKQFCDMIDADESAVIGMGYFGGAKFSDKPAGLSNFDIVVEILEGPKQSGVATKAIHLIGTSSSVYPYRWEYTYWSHGSVSGWRGVESTSKKVTSLSASSTDDEYPSAKCTYDAISSATELYVCTYGTTTYQEITTALASNKMPVCYYDSKIYVYNGLSPTSKYILGCQLFDSYRYLAVSSDDSWTAVVNNFEIISNKVTSISSGSTDSQYPSAKCVYNALPKMYRHNVSVNGHVISILLPFSDTVENHHSSLTAGVVGTFVDTPTGLLTGLGYIYWNVDEWQIYDVSNTEIASKATCADTITELA